MNLNETIEDMTSDQWDYRLYAEFKQTAIRLYKLKVWLEDLENNPDDKEYVYLKVFKTQAGAMAIYALTLLVRLLDTNINIPKTLSDTIFQYLGEKPLTQEEMKTLALKTLKLADPVNQ